MLIVYQIIDKYIKKHNKYRKGYIDKIFENIKKLSESDYK